jgi:hypothetical protein
LVLAIGLASAFVPRDAQEYVHNASNPRYLLIGFVVLVTATSALYFYRERAVDRLREDAQRRLEATTSAIPTLVSTIPLPAFQSDLNLAFEKCLVVSKSVETPEQSVTAVQFILHAIARAAEEFDRASDGRHDPCTYCANIQWLMEPNDPSTAPWDSFVVFRNPGTVLASTERLLVLEPCLSANQYAYPDPKSAPVAFDIPRDHGSPKSNGGCGYQVLPGAPFAVLPCSSFEHFHPANKIREWFQKYGDFNQTVQQAVEKYFIGHQEDIYGFMSVRLCELQSGYSAKEDRNVVGVLNVHWSKNVTLLANAEAARKFIDAVFPLRALLADLMVSMRRAAYTPSPSSDGQAKCPS